MPGTQDIVQKLWNVCHVLRDDGVTYHQYVTELTYILFLKMAKETGTEAQLPKGYRWDDLAKKDGVELLDFYKLSLIHLGSHGSARVQSIFANASTTFRQPRTEAASAPQEGRHRGLAVCARAAVRDDIQRKPRRAHRGGARRASR